MIKTYTIEANHNVREDENGVWVSRSDLQKLWDFCDKEQQYIMERIVDVDADGNRINSNYEIGAVVAYRKIQYEINGKCSKFEDEEK